MKLQKGCSQWHCCWRDKNFPSRSLTEGVAKQPSLLGLYRCASPVVGQVQHSSLLPTLSWCRCIQFCFLFLCVFFFLGCDSVLFRKQSLSASFSLPIPYITCLIQSWEWLIFLLQTHVHTMSCLPSNGPSQKLIHKVMTVFCCRCPVPICRGQSLSVSGFILFWML